MGVWASRRRRDDLSVTGKTVRVPELDEWEYKQGHDLYIQWCPFPWLFRRVNGGHSNALP
jgi:hypothetical protein